MTLALTASAAPAQVRSAPEPQQSVYRRLFPRPTGRNGYEELILAGETARSSRLYLRVENAGSRDTQANSLAFKRRTLADPPVVKALSLIRQGLAKPVLPPRRPEGDADGDHGVQQMRPLRILMRLLALEQYVLLADGRVPEAVEAARRGLRIGGVLYSDPQITGMLGLSIATGSLRTLANNLGQLSARDCERLHQACVEWLRQPDPQAVEMAEARRLIPRTVAAIRARITEGGIPALEELQLYEEEIPEAVKRALAGPPPALDELYRQVERRLEQIYAHNLAQLTKPPWERKWDYPPDDGGPAAQLVDLVHSPYELADTYTRGNAFIQLFACHCAVLRYRWEYDGLPESLDELRLGELAVDPFTGQALRYEVRDSTYRLTSAGPTAEEESPNAVDGRVPFSIMPGDL